LVTEEWLPVALVLNAYISATEKTKCAEQLISQSYTDFCSCCHTGEFYITAFKHIFYSKTMTAASTGTSPSASYLLHIYKVEIVGMYVCMFAYTSRADKLICTKLGMLIPVEKKGN
jgi:hypothetical protein